MMNKFLLGLIILSATFAGCKEIGPAVDLSPITAKDTTFLSTLETPALRTVLVEEYTGVKCPNCPNGAAILRGIEENNPGRLVVVALHSGSLTSPIDGASQYDFRTTASSNLMSTLFGEDPAKPSAAIDRMKESGAYFMDKGLWNQKISDRFTVATKENIKITSTYDTATHQAIIKVHVAYTSNVSEHQNLMVGIIENNIVDAQDSSNGILIPDYHHFHVLRDFLTPVSGSALLDSLSTKAAGRVYERIFIYTVNSNWNPANCQVFAYIFKNEAGQDYEVAQAAETPLKQ